MVLLVALRLAIGWHFFKEGEKKLLDPNFSSAPFLMQARGPLAPTFRTFLPDVHGWKQELGRPLFDSAAERAEKAEQEGDAGTDERPPYEAWSDRILRERKAALDRFVTRQQLDEQARKEAETIFEARRDQLLDYLESESEEIAAYRYELGRLGQMERQPEAAGVPFEKSRIAEKVQETKSKPLVWVRQVQKFDKAFAGDLRGLLQDRADGSNVAVFAPGKLAWLNVTITYVTLGVGVCLILGLFTRTALVVGVVFLMSVIATQPPGWPGVQPMYKEFVETIAMLALATTPVGRWGGLDFFIHTAFSACCGSKESGK
ncbi:MAG: DoxX family protein [Pirellulales bacterium]